MTFQAQRSLPTTTFAGHGVTLPTTTSRQHATTTLRCLPVWSFTSRLQRMQVHTPRPLQQKTRTICGPTPQQVFRKQQVLVLDTHWHRSSERLTTTGRTSFSHHSPYVVTVAHASARTTVMVTSPLPHLAIVFRRTSRHHGQTILRFVHHGVRQVTKRFRTQPVTDSMSLTTVQTA